MFAYEGVDEIERCKKHIDFSFVRENKNLLPFQNKSFKTLVIWHK